MGAEDQVIGLEENCMKDPNTIRMKQALAGHSYRLCQAGYCIVNGRILKMAEFAPIGGYRIETDDASGPMAKGWGLCPVHPAWSSLRCDG